MPCYGEQVVPGPVSDGYDPEFGTGSNASDVRYAIGQVVKKIEVQALMDKPFKNIVEVVHGGAGPLHAGPLTEREWRVIRFCLSRTLEEI